MDVLTKTKRDGTIAKKTRVVKGFRMSQGIDFNETFAPVPCMSSIRAVLAVNTAFLCADMDTDVYILVPNWFRTEATGKELGYTIRKLIKGVPGIPPRGRACGIRRATPFIWLVALKFANTAVSSVSIFA